MRRAAHRLFTATLFVASAPALTGCFDLEAQDDEIALDASADEADNADGEDPTNEDPSTDPEPGTAPRSDDDAPSTEEEDLRRADEVAVALEATSSILHVGSYFAAPSDFAEQTSESAAGAALQAAVDAAEADLDAPECMTVVTDELTFVELTFEGCPAGSGALTLDGTIRGDLSIETEPCGVFDCPSALAYDVTTSDFAIDGFDIDGQWRFEDALFAEAAHWSGRTTVSAPEGASIQFRSEADWSVVDDCTSLSMHADLGLLVNVDVEGFQQCAATCPETGDVSIQGLGQTLVWSFDGDDTSVVTINGDTSFELPLACEPSA